MYKNLLLLFMTLFLWINISFGFTGDETWTGINLSNMSPKELLEFYKKNPDYWKKRVGIDYTKYKEWDYVVFRGEFKEFKTKTPIANSLVKFNFDGKNYFYTTSNEWIFNLELDKSIIKKNDNYRIRMTIDRYYINYVARGEILLNNSIYHFEVLRKEENGIHKLFLKTIHNKSFPEAWNGFTFEERIKIKPSILWIQGLPLILFSILLSFFTGFFLFRKKWIASRDVYLKDYLKKTIAPEKNIEKKLDLSNLKIPSNLK